ALLGKFPLIDSADTSSRTLAQPHQPGFQLFVLQRNEFVKQGKEDHGRKLGEKDEQANEDQPAVDPPVFGRNSHQAVNDLLEDRDQHQAHDPPLGFVSDPGSQLLIRQTVVVLKAEAVEVQSNVQRLADDAQEKHVEEKLD